MPVYEFKCRKCRKKFQLVQSITTFDAKKVKCPKYRSRSVDRQWTSIFTATSKKS